VARRYGVAGPRGITRRSIFVIDHAGIVRWKDVDPTGFGYRTPDEVIDRIKELSSQMVRCCAGLSDVLTFPCLSRWTPRRLDCNQCPGV